MSLVHSLLGQDNAAERISPRSLASQVEGNKVLAATYLLKRSSKTHQWKKKWVALRNCQLSYYKDSSEHKAIKVLNRLNLLSFSAIPDNQKYHFAVYTNKKVLHFKTEDHNHYNTWIHALEVFFEDDEDSIENRPIKVDSPSRQRSTTNQSAAMTEMDYTGPEDVSSGFSDSPLTRHESIPPIIKEQPTIHEEEEDLDRLLRLQICTNDDNDDEHVIEQGYLLRLRKRYNQWRRFFLILTNENLYFYKREDMFDRTYKIIPVTDIIDVIELDPLLRSKVWCMLIITPLKRLRFCAESEEDMIKWLTVLKMVIMRRKP